MPVLYWHERALVKIDQLWYTRSTYEILSVVGIPDKSAPLRSCEFSGMTK